MKTYLLDILNRYNRFSENLDVTTVLCNKSWWIFNDSGDKELYIFQEGGSLIASVNGNVINATWQYISANKSLVISFKEQSYMLHPSFIDNTIFALQQDGTERFLFMINEEQCNSFYPKSLKELNNYFEEIERKRIEEEKQSKKILLVQRRIAQQKLIEQKRLQEEEEKGIILKEEALKISRLYQTLKFITFMFPVFTLIIGFYLLRNEKEMQNIGEIVIMFFTLLFIGICLGGIFALFILLPLQERIIERYKYKRDKTEK